MARAMPNAVVAGESLQSRLDAGERFGQAELLALLRGVAEELADAHRAGRFHGTITPADLRFDSAGEVRLEGWGRDSTPDAMRATRYAPIECYAPVHPQGPWTDVYALGAVLWCAITAEPPLEVLHRKGDLTLARLAPSGFDPAFLGNIDSALEIAPQRRPQTVAHWLEMFAAAPVAAAARAEPPAASSSSDGKAEAAATATASARVPPDDMALPWPLRHIWPVVATTIAAVMGALWATSPPEAPPERASVAPAASSRTPAEAAPPLPATALSVAVTAPEAAPPVQAPATEAPPPVVVAPTPRVVAKPREIAPATESTPTPAAVEVEPAPEPEPEPEATGDSAPRALVARADKRLRQLFGDYARLRADVEDSYDDTGIPYAVKRRAYREGLRIQRQLVELRDVRNRIARTGNFQTANRRFDDFEASAARLDARIDDLRRSI